MELYLAPIHTEMPFADMKTTEVKYPAGFPVTITVMDSFKIWVRVSFGGLGLKWGYRWQFRYHTKHYKLQNPFITGYVSNGYF